MLTLQRDFFIDSFLRMADLAEEQRDHWTKLDGAIGDGDHGINMSIGFREVKKQLSADTDSDVGALYKLVGMTLLKKVGGASGPLYGSFFLKTGTDAKDRQEVTFAEFCDMLKAGVDSILQRGKAQVGEKTMVDSFVPGLETLDAQDKENALEAFQAFVDRMKQGSDDTIPMVAKKGRAMRLGERTIGHRDPGSESSWMLMNCYLEELKKRA